MVAPTPPVQQSATFVYTRCDDCGVSWNGIKINPMKDDKKHKGTIVHFPFAWEGGISDKGLKIFTPCGTSRKQDYVILNEKGTFRIEFNGGKDFLITKTNHRCLSDPNNEKSIEVQKHESTLEVPNKNNKPSRSLEQPAPQRITEVAAALECEGRVYLGSCTISESERSFTPVSNVVATEKGQIGDKVTINMHDGREVSVEVTPIGVILNNILYGKGDGTFKIEALPGKNKFQLTKI